jgi:putative Mg2+ transporter-C (MgtC) family protein
MADENRMDDDSLRLVKRAGYAALMAIALAGACLLALVWEGWFDRHEGLASDAELRECGVMLCRLAIATLLGVVIGIERERREKPAGVRTVAMVTVGACLFALVGASLFSGDDAESRVLQGVVTGIGFLGAGTIIKHEFNVEGLTTAATLWAVTGVGLACGTGHYFLAIVGTGTIWGVLKVLRGLEAQIRPHNGGANASAKK